MKINYGEVQYKVNFHGGIISVQPRSNVWRYRIDNRTHSLTGYNIFLEGTAEDKERKFVVAISEKQQQKARFHIGDLVCGTAWTKKYPEMEYADYYRAGSLKKKRKQMRLMLIRHRGFLWCLIWRPMPGEVQECLTLNVGRINAFRVNGLRWQMWRLSMISA